MAINKTSVKFEEYFIDRIKTPVLMPRECVIISFENGRIIYRNKNNEIKNSAPYMHRTEDAVIVDEFRNLFPHESVIILLFDGKGNIYLQKRGKNVPWEPDKIDLASVVCQGRAELIDDHFRKMDIKKLAIFAISKETGATERELNERRLFYLGNHINENTNEYQAVYAYNLPLSLGELNRRIKLLHEEGQQWFCQNYSQTTEEYFGKDVEKYAGGVSLRPKNFISNEMIRKNIELFSSKQNAITVN
jgi:hypothetical protein